MKPFEPIRIISTGGTFEKIYNPLTGALEFASSHLDTIAERVRLNPPFATQTLMLMDSLEMQDEHRARIAQAVKQSPESRIVIVHGTDTMALTARHLWAVAPTKTVVLTGAMVPYAIKASDALFNLGVAVCAARLATPGVYVAMNGQVFAGDAVRKDREAGRFETVSADRGS